MEWVGVIQCSQAELNFGNKIIITWLTDNNQMLISLNMKVW